MRENDTNGYALSLEDAQLTVHGSLTITGSAWAEDARTLAMAAGMSDGTNPDGSVNREEVVTMLYRYAGSPEMNVPRAGSHWRLSRQRGGERLGPEYLRLGHQQGRHRRP